MQRKVDLRKRNRHIVVVPAKSGVRAAVGSTRGWDFPRRSRAAGQLLHGALVA
jgi:hypothetical protein